MKNAQNSGSVWLTQDDGGLGDAEGVNQLLQVHSVLVTGFQNVLPSKKLLQASNSPSILHWNSSPQSKKCSLDLDQQVPDRIQLYLLLNVEQVGSSNASDIFGTKIVEQR